MGWTNLPFAIPNHRAENGPAESHVRIGWLRSVANIQHAFAIHSFIDELAQLAKRDSVEFLLDVLGPARKIDLGSKSPLAAKYPLDTGRLRNVIELAYFEGLSQTEMAEKMGQPLGTIKTWVRTALKNLREQLGAAAHAL